LYDDNARNLGLFDVYTNVCKHVYTTSAVSYGITYHDEYDYVMVRWGKEPQHGISVYRISDGECVASHTSMFIPYINWRCYVFSTSTYPLLGNTPQIIPSVRPVSDHSGVLLHRCTVHNMDDVAVSELVIHGHVADQYVGRTLRGEWTRGIELVVFRYGVCIAMDRSPQLIGDNKRRLHVLYFNK